MIEYFKIFQLDSDIKIFFTLFLLIGTFISFWRQFIGLKDIGYIASIALGFFLLNYNFLQALILTLTIFAVSFVVALPLQRLIILKFPKNTLYIALVIFVSMIVINIIDFFTGLEISFNTVDIVLLAVLALKLQQMVMTLGPKKYIRNIFQGLIPIVLAVYLLKLNFLQLKFVKYFDLFMVFDLIVLIFIGKYSGLRLVEFFKFNKLLKKEE